MSNCLIPTRPIYICYNGVMLIVGLIRWWYIDGWLGQLQKIRDAFARVADRFSIGLLIKTLFAPFRQISSDEQGRDPGSKMAVLLDKLISRVIGGFMRTVMIIVGSVTLCLLAVLSLLRLVVWPLVPVAPVVGLVLMSAVGAPWKII